MTNQLFIHDIDYLLIARKLFIVCCTYVTSYQLLTSSLCELLVRIIIDRGIEVITFKLVLVLLWFEITWIVLLINSNWFGFSITILNNIENSSKQETDWINSNPKLLSHLLQCIGHHCEKDMACKTCFYIFTLDLAWFVKSDN